MELKAGGGQIGMFNGAWKVGKGRQTAPVFQRCHDVSLYEISS